MIRRFFPGHSPVRQVRRDQRGAAAVEFALVLPILLLVVFGVIAYGFVFAGQITINSSARDAARAGVVQPFGGAGLTCQAIATQARNGSSTIGLAPSSVTVTVSSPTATGSPTCTMDKAGGVTGTATTKMCTGSTAGGQVVVRISYVPKAPVPMVPMPSSLSGTGSFQCEYQ
jgi:Flp pilus assembly protein TadG